MTRIVAGVARGRRLEVPPDGTRPTSERAREALFNTLRAHLDLDGATVLDLYAGSGAVGLEALSRGAAHAHLVESDRAAAAVLARNVAALGLPGAHVHREPVRAYLGRPGAPVDLVFADPPYALADTDLAVVLDALGPHLATDALVVVERAARGPDLSWPPGVDLVTHRRYGDARLWYGRARS